MSHNIANEAPQKYAFIDQDTSEELCLPYLVGPVVRARRLCMSFSEYTKAFLDLQTKLPFLQPLLASQDSATLLTQMLYRSVCLEVNTEIRSTVFELASVLEALNDQLAEFRDCPKIYNKRLAYVVSLRDAFQGLGDNGHNLKPRHEKQFRKLCDIDTFIQNLQNASKNPSMEIPKLTGLSRLPLVSSEMNAYKLDIEFLQLYSSVIASLEDELDEIEVMILRKYKIDVFVKDDEEDPQLSKEM